jgi:hypothetical protein
MDGLVSNYFERRFFMLLDDLINDGNDSEAAEVEGLPVNTEVLFSNHKGVYKKGIEKRQSKQLENINYIKPFLYEDEEILLVTDGCSPIPFFEQFFGGLWVRVQKQSKFIFTNIRIIHVPLKAFCFSFSGKSMYRNSIAQILYSDCESIKQNGRTLKVKYKSGKKESFCYIAPKERKKIQSLIPRISLEGQASNAKERSHLCPQCQGILIRDIYECPNCQLEFKDKKTARKLSWTWPGGGYFYTGHHVMGVFDALAEGYIIFILCIVVIEMIKSAEFWYEGLLIFGVALAVEKMATVYHSNKFLEEFIPVDKEIVPYSRTAIPEALGEYDVDDDPNAIEEVVM